MFLLHPITFEILLLIVIGLVARFGGPRVKALAETIWCRLGEFARVRWLAVVVVALIAASVNIVVRHSRSPAPAPSVHDEFSYLLAADTFRHGRLCNPTHELWPHFESFHIIQQPRYASKYPPGQGLILALGWKLSGEPIVGVKLTVALAAGAVCWMLQGWVSPRWAFLGGLVVALHPEFQWIWGSSYWGGSLAMLGGALLFGSLPRLRRQPSVAVAVALGIGILILANTRPFEGFVVCIPAAAYLGVHWLQDTDSRLKFAKRILLPCGLVIFVGLAGMAFYNRAVTGGALTMPYRVHNLAYEQTPMFLWKSSGPKPSYRHAVMAAFFGNEWSNSYLRQRSWGGFLRMKWDAALGLWFFLLRPALTLPMLLAALCWRCRKLRFPIFVVSVSLAASLSVPWWHAHYMAPVVPMYGLILIYGLRTLRTWAREGNRSGQIMVLLLIAAGVPILIATRPTEEPWSRRPVEQQLASEPGPHLIVVRYRSGHNWHREYVYNEADINSAPIVWAREMSPAENDRLLDYYRDRRVWLLISGEGNPRLIEHRR